jgi:hypothetical protein
MRLTTIALAAASSAALAAESTVPVVAAPSQPLPYISAFDGYRPFKDEPVGSWRDANTEMGKLGGHVGHLGKTKPTEPSASGALSPDMPSSSHTTRNR